MILILISQLTHVAIVCPNAFYNRKLCLIVDFLGSVDLYLAYFLNSIQDSQILLFGLFAWEEGVSISGWFGRPVRHWW